MSELFNGIFRVYFDTDDICSRWVFFGMACFAFFICSVSLRTMLRCSMCLLLSLVVGILQKAYKDLIPCVTFVWKQLNQPIGKSLNIAPISTQSNIYKRERRESHREHGEWGICMSSTYEGNRRMHNHNNTSGDKVEGSVLFYYQE